MGSASSRLIKTKYRVIGFRELSLGLLIPFQEKKEGFWKFSRFLEVYKKLYFNNLNEN
jgi:hypothetical protein